MQTRKARSPPVASARDRERGVGGRYPPFCNWRTQAVKVHVQPAHSTLVWWCFLLPSDGNLNLAYAALRQIRVAKDELPGSNRKRAVMQRTAARGPRDETKKFTNNLDEDLEFEPNHKKKLSYTSPDWNGSYNILYTISGDVISLNPGVCSSFTVYRIAERPPMSRFFHEWKRPKKSRHIRAFHQKWSKWRITWSFFKNREKNCMNLPTFLIA